MIATGKMRQLWERDVLFGDEERRLTSALEHRRCIQAMWRRAGVFRVSSCTRLQCHSVIPSVGRDDRPSRDRRRLTWRALEGRRTRVQAVSVVPDGRQRTPGVSIGGVHGTARIKGVVLTFADPALHATLCIFSHEGRLTAVIRCAPRHDANQFAESLHNFARYHASARPERRGQVDTARLPSAPMLAQTISSSGRDLLLVSKTDESESLGDLVDVLVGCGSVGRRVERDGGRGWRRRAGRGSLLDVRSLALIFRVFIVLVVELRKEGSEGRQSDQLGCWWVEGGSGRRL